LSRLGFDETAIGRITGQPLDLAREEMDRCKKNEVELVFIEDADYPRLLREIFHPPDYIYVKGNRSLLHREMVSIVGSRRASPYGRKALTSLIPDLCRAGLMVASGMAYGIDSLAHKFAIQSGGKTLGVNAGGLLHLNPLGNWGLISEILNHGCIISEFPMEVVPRPHLFPVRNRIISGVSKAVLVVEAALRSGSLITARLALEQNREVLAVPGRIDVSQSQGTNQLIDQGAKVVQSSKDILEEYGIVRKDLGILDGTAISGDEKRILDLMVGNEVNSIDYFVERLQLPVPMVVSLLMGLRLRNLVAEAEGGFFKPK
jgi:DNA processing protein